MWERESVCGSEGERVCEIVCVGERESVWESGRVCVGERVEVSVRERECGRECGRVCVGE